MNKPKKLRIYCRYTAAHCVWWSRCRVEGRYLLYLQGRSWAHEWKSSQRICEHGAVNFSSGWFAQGYVVSTKLYPHPWIDTVTFQADHYSLLPSLNLLTQLYLGSPECLKVSNKSKQFLNLTLSLINPGLFKCVLAMLRKLVFVGHRFAWHIRVR